MAITERVLVQTSSSLNINPTLRAQITRFKEFEGFTSVASGFSLDDDDDVNVDGKEKAFVTALV
ncbi:predicted protein [Sclerotinia sclerotiorum 1980 UF-70]|uniref:Uncharacterized protein n=1 Tax=Sclerotinia sclerotiorum (strain ATCC 18683 / 1980 / Ss-1) TaxID=665079 RepID=A7F9R7_SCLS1|nr:predicted protein [Sclerotinia sclerotiorum 1980 UF-70]EDO00478.1 predicted protein [Sclerotinia sclerotiorum 1980 UF-70]